MRSRPRSGPLGIALVGGALFLGLAAWLLPAAERQGPDALRVDQDIATAVVGGSSELTDAEQDSAAERSEQPMLLEAVVAPRLEPILATVRGRVLLAGSKVPVADASVWAGEFRFDAGEVPVAVSDAAGRYYLENVPCRFEALTLTDHGFRWATFDLHARAGDLRSSFLSTYLSEPRSDGQYVIDLELEPRTTSVAGLVLRAGELVHGAKVCGIGVDGELRHTRSDRQGRYELVGFPAGPVSLFALSHLDGLDRASSAVGTLELVDGMRSEWNLELSVDAGTALTVTWSRVPSSQRTIADLGLSFFMPGPNGKVSVPLPAQRMPEAGGTVCFEALPCGTYEVSLATLFSKDGILPAARTVCLEPGKPVELSFLVGRGVDFAGRVTGLAAPEAAHLRLVHSERADLETSTTVLEDGSFSFSRIPTAAYRLSLWIDGRECAALDVGPGSDRVLVLSKE